MFKEERRMGWCLGKRGGGGGVLGKGGGEDGALGRRKEGWYFRKGGRRGWCFREEEGGVVF